MKKGVQRLMVMKSCFVLHNMVLKERSKYLESPYISTDCEHRVDAENSNLYNQK